MANPAPDSMSMVARRETGATAHPRIGQLLVFLREFLRCPRQTASVIPSSAALERHLVRVARIRDANKIVELGAGTGGLTRALLGSMPPRARLLSVEINPRLCEMIEDIRDERLQSYCGDASKLRQIVDRYRFESPDVVVCGVPVSMMSERSAARLVEGVTEVLAPDGLLVAYQSSKKIDALCSKHLWRDPPANSLVTLNVPPLWVTRWRKLRSPARPVRSTAMRGNPY